MKVIKVASLVVLSVLLFVVFAVALHPFWIGAAVERFAPKIVSDLTGTRFLIGKFDLNLYSGGLNIADVSLQNPESFFAEDSLDGKDGDLVAIASSIVSKTAKAARSGLVAGSFAGVTNAVSFSSFDVKVVPSSMLSDTIRINEIAISDLKVYGDLTFSNIREISKNASDSSEEAPMEGASEEKAAEGGTKVVIDKVILKDTIVQWGPVVAKLPKVEVLDIGKNSAGASDADAAAAILDAICSAADKANVGCGQALRVAIYGGEKISHGVETVSDLANPSEIIDTVKESGKILKNIFK